MRRREESSDDSLFKKYEKALRQCKLLWAQALHVCPRAHSLLNFDSATAQPDSRDGTALLTPSQRLLYEVFSAWVNGLFATPTDLTPLAGPLHLSFGATPSASQFEVLRREITDLLIPLLGGKPPPAANVPQKKRTKRIRGVIPFVEEKIRMRDATLFLFTQLCASYAPQINSQSQSLGFVACCRRAREYTFQVSIAAALRALHAQCEWLRCASLILDGINECDNVSKSGKTVSEEAVNELEECSGKVHTAIRELLRSPESVPYGSCSTKVLVSFPDVPRFESELAALLKLDARPQSVQMKLDSDKESDGVFSSSEALIREDAKLFCEAVRSFPRVADCRPWGFSLIPPKPVKQHRKKQSLLSSPPSSPTKGDASSSRVGVKSNDQPHSQSGHECDLGVSSHDVACGVAGLQESVQLARVINWYRRSTVDTVMAIRAYEDLLLSHPAWGGFAALHAAEENVEIESTEMPPDLLTDDDTSCEKELLRPPFIWYGKNYVPLLLGSNSSREGAGAILAATITPALTAVSRLTHMRQPAPDLLAAACICENALTGITNISELFPGTLLRYFLLLREEQIRVLHSILRCSLFGECQSAELGENLRSDASMAVFSAQEFAHEVASQLCFCSLGPENPLLSTDISAFPPSEIGNIGMSYSSYSRRALNNSQPNSSDAVFASYYGSLVALSEPLVGGSTGAVSVLRKSKKGGSESNISQEVILRTEEFLACSMRSALIIEQLHGTPLSHGIAKFNGLEALFSKWRGEHRRYLLLPPIQSSSQAIASEHDNIICPTLETSGSNTEKNTAQPVCSPQNCFDVHLELGDGEGLNASPVNTFFLANTVDMTLRQYGQTVEKYIFDQDKDNGGNNNTKRNKVGGRNSDPFMGLMFNPEEATVRYGMLNIFNPHVTPDGESISTEKNASAKTRDAAALEQSLLIADNKVAAYSLAGLTPFTIGCFSQPESSVVHNSSGPADLWREPHSLSSHEVVSSAQRDFNALKTDAERVYLCRVVIAQAAIRGALARRKVRQRLSREHKAKNIQTFFRYKYLDKSRELRLHLLHERCAARRIQTWIRGWLAKRDVERVRMILCAIIKIQSVIRMFLVRRKWHFVLRRHRAARTIQACWRQSYCYKHIFIPKKEATEKWGASKIQAIWKGVSHRKAKSKLFAF